jgi:ATP-dependent DNA helicase PIF1
LNSVSLKAQLAEKEVKLTECQALAMDILERGGNVFLTGEAGTGKSFLLNRYLKDKYSESYPVVASTGAAAILVGGRTFHSFFGLGILEGGPENTIRRAMKSDKLIDRLNAAKCVVIDEVSMLSGTMLATAEAIAREARYCEEPWGGLRIIAVGDFAQLPPIDENILGKEWAFLHDVWQNSNFRNIVLNKVIRTDDEAYLRLLQNIRNGEIDDETEEYLMSKVLKDTEDFEGTRLYPHRSSVDKFNIKKLHELKGKLCKSETIYAGKKNYIEMLKKKAPIPETILLKKGALIMIRKNHIPHNNEKMIYVNGSLGKITKVREDVLEIDLLSGRKINLTKQSFEMFNGDGESVAQAYNFPINLAWASTIHKAQGATLDKVLVKLNNLWEPGQAYVALSRTRSGDNLFLEGWSPESIMMEPAVKDFYERIETNDDYQDQWI